MNNAITMNTTGGVAVRSLRLRVSSLLVASLLVFSAVLLLQHRAEAAPARPAAVTAQIDVGALIRQIACPILVSVRNAFAGSPFFSFAAPILNSLLASFGCNASGG